MIRKCRGERWAGCGIQDLGEAGQVMAWPYRSRPVFLVFLALLFLIITNVNASKDLYQHIKEISLLDIRLHRFFVFPLHITSGYWRGRPDQWCVGLTLFAPEAKIGFQLHRFN